MTGSKSLGAGVKVVENGGRGDESRPGAHPRWRAAAVHLGILVLFFGATPAPRAEGPTLVALGDIEHQGLRRGVFILPETTGLQLEAEGLADRKGETFLAYGWILDLESRQPVWKMPDAPGRFDKKTGNWRTDERIELPEGIYAVYFAAYGGHIPLDEKIRILGFTLGRIEANWGPYREWDDEGEPERWGIRVRATDAGYVPKSVPAVLPEPYPDAIVREVGLGDRERRTIGLELGAPVDLQIWATGEYSQSARSMADDAWIVDRRSFSRVWELSLENTLPAGGGEKNRVFSGKISLPPGSFLVNLVTDDNHSTDDWNTMPPWDPESWGVAIGVVRPEDRARVQVTSNPELPAPVVSIQEMPSDAFVGKPFRVTRPARVLLRALGECARVGEYSDYGWIENRLTLDPVWTMESLPGHSAGGAPKNRLVEAAIDLPAGSYNLCYVTDDSHAYGEWNDDPPLEAEAWGITLAEVGGTGAIQPGKDEQAPAVISLAPVGSGEHVAKRFETEGPTRVLVIAVGEGSKGEMYDYGWIENEATEEMIWEMNYTETAPAGGGKKNREARTHLDLPMGRYTLHYMTDGSHAFGDWNAMPPRQPQLWGITLIERAD